MSVGQLVQTEAQFQAAVVDLAERLGWLVYHTHDSRRSNAGFPDLVLVRDERLVFAELKTEKGKVKPEQQAWLDALATVIVEAQGRAGDGELRHTHLHVCLWRPSDWDEIERVLARR